MHRNFRHVVYRYSNALKKLWTIDISRMYPLAMFAPCYLSKSLPDRVDLHRQLWWRTRYKLPVILWLPLEFVRWLNWRLWYAYYLINKSILKHGLLIETQQGISISEQRKNITFWAKQWMVHPNEAYVLGLYHSNVDGLNCLLGSEYQAFHLLLNEQNGVMKKDYQLLADKTTLGLVMQSVGIPMVETSFVSKGDYHDLILALQKDAALFCKLRSGSRGESAFRVEKNTIGISGQTLAGHNLHNEQDIRLAWQELTRKGEVLIQPYMQNHPLLESLDSEVMTLRVITRLTETGIATWFGFLYVQVPGDKIDREYWLLSVDLNSGVLCDAFDHWNTKQAIQTNQPLPIFLEGKPMPFWQEIKHYSELAHEQLPRVWAIAWDWVITPDGPKLLEGNSGWDLSPLSELEINFFDIYRANTLHNNLTT